MMTDGQRWGLAVFALACVILTSVSSLVGAAETLDLAGAWRFRIDRDDRGLADHWQEPRSPVKMPSRSPAPCSRRDMATLSP